MAVRGARPGGAAWSAIYASHLRAFLACAEESDSSKRVAAAAAVLELLDEANQDWSALLDLSVAEAYAAGVKQGDLGQLLGATRQMASIRAAHGKREARSLNRVVSAALRAARNQNAQ